MGNLLAPYLHLMVYFTDSIFLGMKMFIPLIWLLDVLQVRSRFPGKLPVVWTANRLILMSACMVLLNLISNMLIAWSQGNEAERDIILSFIQGPHWYQFVVPIINYALLPLLLFHPFIRSSISFSFSLVMIWLSSYLLVDKLANGARAKYELLGDLNEGEFFSKMMIFLFAYSVFFLLARSKQKRDVV